MMTPTDHTLTVRQVADQLGVDTEFVRGEIIDGRLSAAVEIRRPGGRTYRRIARTDFLIYCRKWCPRVAHRISK
jgi:excisionase family DNA binding protein